MNRWSDFDDYLADDVYSEDDIAFEKMSEEFLADKRGLKNPRGSCSTPHGSPGKGSGDGTCYQVHHDYGEAKSGANGSTERAEYMVEYRKHHYNNRKNGPKKGLDSREIVPKPYPKNKPPEEGIGKHTRKKASISTLSKIASEERYALLKMAYENPSLRGEVFEILSKKNTKVAFRKSPSPKIKKLKNPRQQGCNSYKVFSDWTDADYEKYVNELIDGYPDAVFGQCYQTHNDYGSWGGKSKGSDKAYQKWYNDNVRKWQDGSYLGPQRGKDRSKQNRRTMVENYFKKVPSKQFFNAFVKRLRDDPSGVPQKLLEDLGLKKDKDGKVTTPSGGGVSTSQIKSLFGGGGSSKSAPAKPAPKSAPAKPAPKSAPAKSAPKPAPKSESAPAPRQTRRRRERVEEFDD